MRPKLILTFLVVFFFNFTNIFAQTSCTGSLGDPIVNVTFGQGINPGAPLAVSVPGATTSYTYVAPVNDPPQNIVLDGNYSLVNNTPSNPYWLSSRDHTNGSTGYMAFFNAAPTPGEFYRQTVSGLCAGTTYEFAAWVLNAINISLLPSAVPPNITFKIYNPANLVTPLATFSTGDIPGTSVPVWRQYATLFTTPAGINSVIITLNNNNVGGTSLQGNDLAIDDITFRACGPFTGASFSAASSLTSLTICNNTAFTTYGSVSTGLNSPAYQWQISTDGINWTNIPGATSLNYVSTGNTTGIWKYRLSSGESSNIASSFCKFYSNPITLNVTACTTCAAFTADAGTDTTFCSNGPVSKTLHATGGTNFSWSPSGFLNDSHSPDPVATVTSTTKFYVSVSDALGCSGIDSVTLFVNANPIIATSGNSTICKDSLLHLNASGASTYNWAPVSAFADPLAQSPLFTGIQTTSVTVVGTAANGCKDTSYLSVNVKPLPLVNTIKDTIICSTATITLTTTGSAASYSWSPQLYLDNSNNPSPSFHGPSGNEYVVTGTLNGCTSGDSLLITVKSPAGLLQPPSKSLCTGSSVTLDGNNGNLVQYQWSPAQSLSNPNIINPIANPAISTLYTVSVTDPYCNFANTFNVAVTVLPAPIIHAYKSNDVNCLVMSSNLNATGAKNYTWSPGGTISSIVVANPIVTPETTTTYYVTGTNEEGCSGKDSILVEKDNGEGFVYIPNTFTPNNDSKNDCFKVLVKGEIRNFDFAVFNRNGEKVFETQDSDKCWDGNYKGKKALLGNYVYYFTAYTRCGKIVKKGNVILIR